MAVTKLPKKKIMVVEQKKLLTVDKEKYHQKKVAAYCRVSTDDEEQLTSYKNQMHFYSTMIAENKEWEFAGMYADEGISGTRADKRPEFKRMIRDCLAGKIDYVITKSVSRFARNTVDCLDYVRMLKARGIGIYFEEQGIDTLKSDSELYLVIYAGFAQSESESISKNVTWSFRKKFEEGKPIFVYKRLLGYKKGPDGEPMIEPYEAEIVKRIFDMYLGGETIRGISNKLQAENISIPGKNLTFGQGMILNILKNEKYCGDCVLQKTVTVDCISKTRKKNEGEAPMYIVENSHPAIISRRMFNKVQEELSRRNTIKPQTSKQSSAAIGKYSRYALSEVMICEECGSRYRRVTWTSCGKKRVVWRCTNRLAHGKAFCKESPTVPEDALKCAVVRAQKKYHREDEETYLALMQATISDALGFRDEPEEITSLEQRIETLNARMVAIVSTSVANGTDIESHEEEFREITEECEQLKRRIEAIRESMLEEGEIGKRTAKIQNIIKERLDNDDQYSDSSVRQMVECIKVKSDNTIDVIFGGGFIATEQLA